MIVVTLSDVPPKIRGDLSKWLFEISLGVYVGHLSGRVRDNLWERICLNIGKGKATMVYNAEGEQRLAFKTCNSDFEPVDFDGICLMRRPLPQRREVEKKEVLLSDAEIRLLNMNRGRNRADVKDEEEYVAVDIETTGLSIVEDSIIEIAGVRVKYGRVAEEYNSLIKTSKKISTHITALTGLNNQILEEQGYSENEVLQQFRDFIGSCTLIIHNSSFDRSFIQEAYKKNNLGTFRNKVIDTLMLARKKLYDIQDYRLSTLGDYFGIESTQLHRAKEDCLLTYQVYEKLKVL